jgi:hypothetical protein
MAWVYAARGRSPVDALDDTAANSQARLNALLAQ